MGGEIATEDPTRSNAEDIKSARAKRNRDAATRSRQQTKEKKKRLEGENKVLSDRITELEKEHEELQRQYIAKYGQRKNF
ncbi:hypothetical protein NDN08_006624 [Rhodosorus marinus]|uniref:BZIP domain-containing protein n=1 Tax=Rhodosorus marinus TaxID=101924 RepID=A0AAV8UNI1_9RHOD|nr:hypothetical protein NDN08_006624 [Rhodosorus marinus]